MHRLVRPVEVVVQLERAERVALVVLVPDADAVQEVRGGRSGPGAPHLGSPSWALR